MSSGQKWSVPKEKWNCRSRYWPLLRHCTVFKQGRGLFIPQGWVDHFCRSKDSGAFRDTRFPSALIQISKLSDPTFSLPVLTSFSDFGIRAISEVLTLYISTTFRRKYRLSLGFPAGWVVKNPPANAGSIPRSGRSPREGKGNPLQYSCLGNPTDRGAWQATVHGVAKSRTWLKWLSKHTTTK